MKEGRQVGGWFDAKLEVGSASYVPGFYDYSVFSVFSPSPRVWEARRRTCLMKSLRSFSWNCSAGSLVYAPLSVKNIRTALSPAVQGLAL